MAQGLQALTEKEKQTLRLMGRGHDAKSMARHLGLSVHTVNDRLRAARTKLSVSSSREAARLLLDREGATPENHADDVLGDDPARPDPADDAPSIDARRPRPAVRLIAGVAIMSILLGLAAALMVPHAGPAPAGSAAASPARADVARAARDWLELVDASRWEDSWQATSTQFRTLNTVEMWAKASEQARRPLGAMVSRTILSQDSVPAPPAGVEVVKFRTRFANRAEAVETVSLAREDGAWKVVGIYID